MGGNKTFFTVGGKGKKPDEDFRHATAKRFTKGIRGTKPILAYQTRINSKLTDNRLRNMTEMEMLLQKAAFIEAQSKDPFSSS